MLLVLHYARLIEVRRAEDWEACHLAQAIEEYDAAIRTPTQEGDVR